MLSEGNSSTCIISIFEVSRFDNPSYTVDPSGLSILLESAPIGM